MITIELQTLCPWCGSKLAIGRDKTNEPIVAHPQPGCKRFNSSNGAADTIDEVKRLVANGQARIL